jgi:hypothetical protein
MGGVLDFHSGTVGGYWLHYYNECPNLGMFTIIGPLE